MNLFEEILDFIGRCQLKKALTDKHKVYRSHIKRFWTSERYEGKTRLYTHSLVVLDLKDKDDDLIGLSERLCKGLWFRMGFTGVVNESHYNKHNLSQPYKFLVHSVIHTMGHRKGGYDVAVDYIMCIVTALILNCPYNFSQVIFEHMKAKNTGDKFSQYPTFIQMLLDDKNKNLEKDASNELILYHMSIATLDRLNVYKLKKSPPKRRKLACNENQIMSLLRIINGVMMIATPATKISKWSCLNRKDQNGLSKMKRRKRKVNEVLRRKRLQRSLPSEDEAQNVNENVEIGAAGPSTTEVAQEIEDIVFEGIENVQVGYENVGENVEGTAENVEGVVSSSLMILN
ncbi:hypothetical protein Hanom_Chr06g00529231 [Helianthus anomalus]